ncbi:MAG: ABC transporter substrate-binding protein [Candidatus Marinimicrobia bacterium]|nr:ABC transporter substrate-binding protein [Candidatus Neomarinimicrobiota bacterium]
MLKHKTSRYGFSILLTIMVLLAGCNRSKDSSANLRIVSLAPNWTQTVVEIGAKDQLVGVTRFCIYPAEIPEMVIAGDLISIGGFVDLSMSRVDSLKPDLVLTATGMQLRFHDFLKEQGIPFIHMEETSLAETYEKILALGTFINKGTEAGKLIESIKSELVSMEQEFASFPNVKVYYEINYAYKCVPGADSYIIELMRMVGADPIYADRPGIAPSVTWDDVLVANPEVILIPWWETAWQEGTHFKGPQRGYGTTSIGEVAAREGAQTITAVKTGKVRYINSAKTKQAGPMIPIAVRLFAEAIHAPGRPARMQMDFVPQFMEEQDTFVPELEVVE